MEPSEPHDWAYRRPQYRTQAIPSRFRGKTYFISMPVYAPPPSQPIIHYIHPSLLDQSDPAPTKQEQERTEVQSIPVKSVGEREEEEDGNIFMKAFRPQKQKKIKKQKKVLHKSSCPMHK